MYYVYIIECQDKTLYTGISTDPIRRFMEHENGSGAKYTRTHKANRLIYIETAENRSAATRREIEIKKLSRRAKLKLIESSSNISEDLLQDIKNMS